MEAEPKFFMEIHVENCGNCVYCLSACPFEAISQDPETKKVKVDPKKCVACGICYSACPSGQITTAHYNIDVLNSMLDAAVAGNPSTLVLSCRGSAPERRDVEGLWEEKELAFLSLPCIGRVPLQFYIRCAEVGLQKVHILVCEDEYCRMKKGSPVAQQKLEAARLMLEDLGYDSSMLDLKKGVVRAELDSNRCIACGNCVWVCPYHAPRLVTGTAAVDANLCKGCGICVAECPALAIRMKGSEHEELMKAVKELAAAPGKPKVLAMVCRWAEYLHFDRPVEGGALRVLPMPCSGRGDVLHILEAFRNGVDGVLLATCVDEMCKQENRGDKRAQAHAARARGLLRQLGIDGRMRVSAVTPKYLGQFESEVEAFIRELGAAPPGGGGK
ncbi:MAG: hydrogenase iron-sulfur subunit [Euryarchaeota archaeon]|nr:hydrogenase iron-sulfur subunit [Euryarchaeota archaeon]